MRSVRIVICAIALGASAGTAAILAQQRSTGSLSPGRPIALVGGTVIDGTGSVPIRNSVVLIRGERIERVGTVASLPVPAGYDRISTDGMTVLPGLWDLHVHRCRRPP
jgi:imidazolonepropionase-like amidohydrolase